MKRRSVKTRETSHRQSPRVALLIETSNAYGRGLLSGVADYVAAHGPWSIYLPEAHRADDTIASRLRGWRGDGVLVRAEDRATATAAAKCGSAIVDLSASGLMPNVPAVHSDTAAEAALAFEHLWERGFRSLGFCGVKGYPWVRWQQDRFTKLASDAGAELFMHMQLLRTAAGSRGWAADRNTLVRWLMELPKPIGIFACYDLLGQQLLDACRAANLRIPDDVAVIGVDDDAVWCSLSDPPLSSVAPDARRVGYEAAQLLAKIMNGQRVPPGMRLIPPTQVTARRSTDALAISDPDVAAALRFIRDHCCEPIAVSDVLNHVPLSRRSLETRFANLVGRTPHAEIVRSRVERARQLLAGTDLPIKTIANRVGLPSPEYLSVLFRRSTHMSPSSYRNRFTRTPIA